jgi:hypothetical protein
VRLNQILKKGGSFGGGLLDIEFLQSCHLSKPTQHDPFCCIPDIPQGHLL